MNGAGTPLRDVVAAIESIAPPRHAESWDNVGLLVGDRSQRVRRAMLTIDYTPDVAEEAKSVGCELIVAYHPPLFEAVKRVTADGPTALIHDAIRRGVAIYSPHTALDAADGGTNDVLADLMSLADRWPLRVAQPSPTHAKLVTFAPADAVERVGDALFAAGCGKIGGNYSRCSFRSDGTGTFQGDEGSDPTVGEAGKFERVPEVKIETVVPLDRIADALAALRKAHPYEEPAFDLQSLLAPPTAVGIGRVGRLPGEATVEMLANLLKRGLGVDRLLVVGPPDRMVKAVAVCAGAGGSLLGEAIARRADLFVTGELRHHDALRAASSDVAVICTLHSNSERVTMSRLADRLRSQVAGVEFLVSTRDRDPFTIV